MDVGFTRCAGLDVHKKRITACRMIPDPTGQEAEGIMELRTFGTMTRDLLVLADWLTEASITPVAMESTGEYTPPGIWPTRYESGNRALRLSVPACACVQKSRFPHRLATP
jgi:hypothetical protein